MPISSVLRDIVAAIPWPNQPYQPLKGLAPVANPTSPAPFGELENVFAEKVPGGMRVAMQFRSRSVDEAPASIRVFLTQTPLGNQELTSFTGVVKPVFAGATVSEGEIVIDYAKFPAVLPGKPIGLWVKWPTGHDRQFGEAPQYTVIAL